MGRLTESDSKMPLSEIRRILKRGEWWDNVRDVPPDEPRPWLDELNSAIEAALDELQAYRDAEGVITEEQTKARLSEAIGLLSDFCDDISSCKDCPFCDVRFFETTGGSRHCMLKRDFPMDWDREEWRWPNAKAFNPPQS